MDSATKCPAPADLGSLPSEVDHDLLTSTGRALVLRPIRPDDGSRLREFHEHLSSRSVYLRYFYMHPRLSPVEVDRFTHVDYVDRFALVVEDQDRIVGVGRYERTPGTTEAEVAFIVADEAQHQGIGHQLLARLAEAAVANGITVFVAQTLAENRAMLDVFMKSGFPVSSKSEYGTVDIRFPIDGVPERPGADGPGMEAQGAGQGTSPREAGSHRPTTVGHAGAEAAPVPVSPCLWS